MHAIIFKRQSKVSFFCPFFIFRANQTLIAFSVVLPFGCDMLQAQLFLQQPHLTQNTVSAELFLQYQRLPHRQYGKPVTMATVV